MTSKVHYSSAKAEWGTPRAFFKAYDDRFHFTLDVCASHLNAKCPRYYAKADDGHCVAVDGLAQPWGSERCWCNPPYGRGRAGAGPWLAKAVTAVDALVVALVAARTDTKWFHRFIWPFADEIHFVEGRLKFDEDVDPALAEYGECDGVLEEAEHGAPFPSLVAVYLPKSPRRALR